MYGMEAALWRAFKSRLACELSVLSLLGQHGSKNVAGREGWKGTKTPHFEGGLFCINGRESIGWHANHRKYSERAQPVNRGVRGRVFFTRHGIDQPTDQRPGWGPSKYVHPLELCSQAYWDNLFILMRIIVYGGIVIYGIIETCKCSSFWSKVGWGQLVSRFADWFPISDWILLSMNVEVLAEFPVVKKRKENLQ